MIANLIAARASQVDPTSPITPTARGPPSDPFFLEAKMQVSRMLDILEHVGSNAPEMQKTRTEVLREAVEAMTG